MSDIKCKNVYSRVNSDATPKWRKTQSSNVVHREVAHTDILSMLFFFFFNDPAPPEIYPLPLPRPLPISFVTSGSRTALKPSKPPGCGSRPIPMEPPRRWPPWVVAAIVFTVAVTVLVAWVIYYLATRSEEHTSELQSQSNLVCRLLLEKKK